MKFTDVELWHLLSLLDDAEAEGGYYGNKAQYWKRHERIKAKLRACKGGEREQVFLKEGSND